MSELYIVGYINNEKKSFIHKGKYGGIYDMDHQKKKRNTKLAFLLLPCPLLKHTSF